MSAAAPSEPLAAALADVRARIAEAARAVGRDPEAVTLVAVSKQHPATAVEAALVAGHRLFGENRVQEAQAKYPELRAGWPDLRLHLLGPLQSNKAADAVALFDGIQSVDRPKIARVLAQEMAARNRHPDLFVQVNTGEEPQKAGVPPQDLDAFVAWCRDDLGLDIAGLMCIPPQAEDPALHFALLAEAAARLGLRGLSMGMSGDFETAVRLGATHVRVGSALFGARPPAGRSA